MDKPRHPHVVRTWTVERTRTGAHGPHFNPAKDRSRGPAAGRRFERRGPERQPEQPKKP